MTASSQTARLNHNDRIAIEEACIALAAIAHYAHDHPEFKASLQYVPVPGGKSFANFAAQLGATAVRFPTDWAAERRRENEAA